MAVPVLVTSKDVDIISPNTLFELNLDPPCLDGEGEELGAVIPVLHHPLGAWDLAADRLSGHQHIDSTAARSDQCQPLTAGLWLLGIEA